MLVIFPEGNIFVMVHFPPKPGLASSGCQYRIEPSGTGRQNRTHQHLLHQPVLHWGCDVQIRIGPLQGADYCTNSVNKTQNT